METVSGRLIVFEGLDGSGKTTQAERLTRHLRESGCEVLSVEEPGGTALGRTIRGILLRPEIELQPLTELLFYIASRHELVRRRIKPALDQGATVVSQRFTPSSVAYQGYGRGLELELIEELNRRATEGIEPDIILWLDLPPETGLRRLQRESDRIEQEGLEFLQRVREGYEELAERIPQMVRLDGTRAEEDIFRSVLRTLKAFKGGQGGVQR